MVPDVHLVNAEAKVGNACHGNASNHSADGGILAEPMLPTFTFT